MLCSPTAFDSLLPLPAYLICLSVVAGPTVSLRPATPSAVLFTSYEAKHCTTQGELCPADSVICRCLFIRLVYLRQITHLQIPLVASKSQVTPFLPLQPTRYHVNSACRKYSPARRVESASGCRRCSDQESLGHGILDQIASRARGLCE